MKHTDFSKRNFNKKYSLVYDRSMGELICYIYNKITRIFFFVFVVVVVVVGQKKILSSTLGSARNVTMANITFCAGQCLSSS